MKDLAFWRSLKARKHDDAELIAQLREMAGWPILHRLPFLGWLSALARNHNADVRAAAISCLAESHGVAAFQLIIGALQDPSSAVRGAAVEALRASAIGNDVARWAHVIFHPDADVREAGLNEGQTFPPPSWWMLYLLTDPVSAPLVRIRLQKETLPAECLMLILDYARRGVLPRQELRSYVHGMSWENCMNFLARWGIRAQQEIDAVLAAVHRHDGPEQIHRVASRHPVIDLFELFADADDEASDKWFARGRGEYLKSDDARVRVVASMLVSAVRWGHHRGSESRPLPWLKSCAMLYPAFLGCSWLPLSLRRAALHGLYEPGAQITKMPDAEVYQLLRSELCRRPDGQPDLWAVGAVLHLMNGRPYQWLLQAIPIAEISAAFEADPEAAIAFLGVVDPGGEERKYLIRELCLQPKKMRARVLARLCVAAPLDALDFLDQLDAPLALELFQEFSSLTDRLKENKLRRLAGTLAEKIAAGLVNPFLQAWLKQPAPEDNLLGLAILTVLGRQHAPRLLQQGIAILTAPELQKLVTCVNYAAGFPYDRELEVARTLEDHADDVLRSWSTARLQPAPGRKMVDREALLKSGLCHQLRADTESRRPNVDICASLLASYDLLSEVDQQFARFGSTDPSFISQLDQEMIYSWRGESRLPILGQAWLYRWEEHSAAFDAVFCKNAASLTDTLKAADTLTCSVLRQRIWDAAIRCLELRLQREKGSVEPLWSEALANVFVENLTADVAEQAARLLMFWRELLPKDPLWGGIRLKVMAQLVLASEAVRKILASWIDSQGLPVQSLAQVVQDSAATLTGFLSWLIEPVTQLALENTQDLTEVARWLVAQDQVVAEQARKRWLALAIASTAPPVELLRALPDFPKLTAFIDEYVEKVNEPRLEQLPAVVGDASVSPRIRFQIGRALTRRGKSAAIATLIDILNQPGPVDWLNGVDLSWFLLSATSLGYDDRELAAKLVISPHPVVYQYAVRNLLNAEAPALPEVCQALVNFLELGTDRMRELRVEAANFLHNAGWTKQVLPLLLQTEIEAEPRYPELFVGQTFDVISATISGVLLADWGENGEAMILAMLLADGVDGYYRQEGLALLLQHAKSDSVRQQARQKMSPSLNRSFKLRRVAETFAWGIRVGRELTGKLFSIEMISGEKLGYTRFNENKIYITPLPILRGELYGREVVRALILHEFGHHMYHRGQTAEKIWNQSQQEGLQRLLNLVSDEHLERNLRALDRRFGDQLKLLGSYAFQHTSRDVMVENLLSSMQGRAFEILSTAPLQVARRYGCVTVMNGRILMQMERFGLSFARFVRALRMGLGNRHDDPKVEEALQLFRGKFRKSDMPRLYEITKKLREIFGSETDILESFDQDALLEAEGDELDSASEGITNDEIQGEVKKHLEGRHDRKRSSDDTRGGRGLNLGPEEHFDLINKVQQMPFDSAQHASYAHQVNRPAQVLRRFLQKLGIGLTQQRFRLTGKSFDRTRARAVVLRGDPRMLIAREPKQYTDLFIGVVIDCSGSMSHNSNIEKAKLFGTLIAEAAKGYPGVDVRLFGFTDQVIYDAGTATRCAVHALEAGGGNNDAAGLWHAALAAKASRRRAKLLVMISDGAPTECTVTALRSLVTRLTKRMKMCCAQVAVCPLEHQCFPNYILLDQGNVEASVRQFGNTMAKLVQQALRG